MITIHKYSLPYLDHINLDLPEGATILAFQMQGSIPTIWVLVDDQAVITERHFRLCGTGHNIGGNPGRYIGTIQDTVRGFVWHLFEEFP